MCIRDSGKAAPAAKEILFREAEKLQTGLHIGALDKLSLIHI